MPESDFVVASAPLLISVFKSAFRSAVFFAELSLTDFRVDPDAARQCQSAFAASALMLSELFRSSESPCSSAESLPLTVQDDANAARMIATMMATVCVHGKPWPC